MERILGSRECDRCGTSITSFCPSLPTFSSIGNYLGGPRDALETKIAELEAVPKEVVREYMRHRMFAECEVLYGVCHICGHRLASRLAKQCLNCHASWHEKRDNME
jgi:hypothetical protein